jgi:Protein of unknown function (DUF3096)
MQVDTALSTISSLATWHFEPQHLATKKLPPDIAFQFLGSSVLPQPPRKLNEAGHAEQSDSYRPAANSPSSLAASLTIGTSPIAKAPLRPSTSATSAIEMRISSATRRGVEAVTVNIVLLQPLIALIAGILILVVPRLLNYIVAIYLIIVGLAGLLPHAHLLR